MIGERIVGARQEQAAGGPIPSDAGGIHAEKDKQMNMIASAKDFSRFTVADAPHDSSRVYEVAVDTAALRRLDLTGLEDFHDVINTVNKVVQGLSCAPRFDAGDHDFNAAGRMVEELMLFLDEYLVAAEHEIARRNNRATI